jgi:hypothetical protein
MAEHRKSHTHCWHDDGMWANGMATMGGRKRKCCHCGERQERHVTWSDDPKHGPHAPVSVERAFGDWREVIE